MDKATQKSILESRESIFGSHQIWGEPNLGSIYGEQELLALTNSVKNSSSWYEGFGYSGEVSSFEQKFSKLTNSTYSIAVSNCGVAFDLIFRFINLKPGDEVISPAINFKGIQLIALGYGAKIVFADIDPETMNIDPDDVLKKLTPKTKVVIPVHIHGLPCDIIHLNQVLSNSSIVDSPPLIIADSARACGARYRENMVGSEWFANCFSFHSGKIITTLGEGGMITTPDPKLAEFAYYARKYGGEDFWGSNFKMTSPQAAVGIAQLERVEELISLRRKLAQQRTSILSSLTEEIKLPSEPDGFYHIYYVYPILLPEYLASSRDSIVKYMQENFKIKCSITNDPTYKRWKYIKDNCGIPELPVTEDVASRLMCLPIHPQMTEMQNKYIVAAFVKAFDHFKSLCKPTKS